MRMVTQNTLLYTEMTQAPALTYNQELEKYLGPKPTAEDPVALQLGGSDPHVMSEAAYLAASFGDYHSINVNCGCPSNKAKKAGYGAELMLEPELTRQIVHEMCRKVTSIPITVKCRVGVVPYRSSVDHLVEFIEACKAGGARNFIIHARDVVLHGLSPAQNRTIPPLKYETAFEMAQHFRELDFCINGGVKSFDQADELLSRENGVIKQVMIGREAYRDPWIFHEADDRYYSACGSSRRATTRRSVLDDYLEYCDKMHQDNVNTCSLLKPLHSLFAGCAHERAYKIALDKIFIQKKSSSVGDIVFESIASATYSECECEQELLDWLEKPLQRHN